ncbi:MAG: PASTA domain-containing protein [Candidatus Babeliaceae bacterium]|nr:PASTA domain-containing protein [Candidatus Babeliaceae bacterium]
MKQSFYIFIPFLFFLAGFGLLSFFIYEKSIKTPALLGHSVVYALRQATDRGFTLKILSEKESSETIPGTILAQKPIPGALIKPKQAVFISISKEPYQSKIPDFSSLQLEESQRIAQEKGIFIKEFPLMHHLPSRTVIAQNHEPDILYDNQTIHLFVSAGPQTRRIMPDLTEQEHEAVRKFLESYGIKVTIFKEPYDAKRHKHLLPGTVIAQKPLAGSWIDLKKPLIVQLVVI